MHGRDLQAAAVELEANHVAVGHAQLPGRLGAEERGVAPGELGDRVGELLEPAVVGEPAVVDLGVALQHQLEVVGRERPRARLGGRDGPGDRVPLQGRLHGGIGAGREVPSWRNFRQAASKSASVTPLIFRNERRTIS